MSRTPSPAERAVFGSAPQVVSPRTVAELCDVVREAESEGRGVVPTGVGAHPETADPPTREPILVSTEHLTGPVAYEPDDFTLGVHAGTRLDELRDLLRRHRQELACDWPRGGAGTIGGLVARAPFSPRQGSTAPLHALVLGVEGVRGGGTAFKSGGMVVKNVAGYQVHKVVVGSLGRLGVLTRINFRLRPIPERRVAAVAGFESAEAAASFARALRARRLEPACLALLSGSVAAARLPWPDGDVRVAWLFEGNPRRVEWLAAEASKVATEAKARAVTASDDDAGEALLDFLVGFDEPGADRDVGIAHVAVASSEVARALADLGRRLRERSGLAFRILADALSGVVVVRWSASPAQLAAPLADVVETAGRFAGNARLVHLPGAIRGRHPRDLTPDPNATLADRIRAAFDPNGVFSSGTAAPAEAAR